MACLKLILHQTLNCCILWSSWVHTVSLKLSTTQRPWMMPWTQTIRFAHTETNMMHFCLLLLWLFQITLQEVSRVLRRVQTTWGCGLVRWRLLRVWKRPSRWWTACCSGRGHSSRTRNIYWESAADCRRLWRKCWWPSLIPLTRYTHCWLSVIRVDLWYLFIYTYSLSCWNLPLLHIVYIPNMRVELAGS